jgi:hypothetical protein
MGAPAALQLAVNVCHSERLCHSERSEESQRVLRPFAALRVTVPDTPVILSAAKNLRSEEFQGDHAETLRYAQGDSARHTCHSERSEESAQRRICAAKNLRSEESAQRRICAAKNLRSEESLGDHAETLRYAQGVTVAHP